MHDQGSESPKDRKHKAYNASSKIWEAAGPSDMAMTEGVEPGPPLLIDSLVVVTDAHRGLWGTEWCHQKQNKLHLVVYATNVSEHSRKSCTSTSSGWEKHRALGE